MLIFECVLGYFDQVFGNLDWLGMGLLFVDIGELVEELVVD